MEELPAIYGPHTVTTVYNRFNRWIWKGLWGRIFAELVVQAEVPENLSIDSTAVRAHRSAHGGKEGKAQATRRSRGGPATKIHVLTDACGRIAGFSLTTQEGRDAVRPPQAASQSDPPQAPGIAGSRRRIPPRSHRTEPKTPRKTRSLLRQATGSARLRCFSRRVQPPQ